MEELQSKLEYATFVAKQQSELHQQKCKLCEELIEDLKMLSFERDFYRKKFEELQIKLFLSNFTQEEQLEILKEIK